MTSKKSSSKAKAKAAAPVPPAMVIPETFELFKCQNPHLTDEQATSMWKKLTA